ncbi:MAG: SIR2 family protein [Ectothiorhodospiraceae bacterium]|nr:SIR2 family protein [Ectothiorhodospiraceae bacterium]
MKLSKLGIDKPANVILGAGASRGASCFGETWAQSPLDADFFNQIDRLKATPEGAILQELTEFARSEFNAADWLGMETFFTQLEALDEFYTSLNIDRGPKVRFYNKVLDRYPTYLASTFRALEAIVGASGLRCDYHEALASAVRSGDSVISLNYDCLFDGALRAKAGKSWNAQEGYGVRVQAGHETWHDHSGRGRVANNSIKLLKVHGSLNWDRGGGNGVLRLRRNPYEDGARSKNEIIPPVWNKQISNDEVVSGVWKAARNALRVGPVLVVIGYSVPDTDVLTQVLLRVATSESGKTLSHLISVNPDYRAHEKLRKTVGPALTKKSTIVELGRWEELCRLL